MQAQMSQQNSSLKTSISTQLGQLKNILSTYSVRIEESQLNWIQVEPLTVIAQTHVTKAGAIEVKNIFTKSGSKTERWTKDFLQKALSLKKHSGKSIHSELFQTKAGDKYLAITFTNGGASADGAKNAVTVLGEANYFQKFFDLNRSRKITHLLMTDANIVAGHSESEYVATQTAEGQLNLEKYFVEKEELRSSNLNIISYVPKSAVLSLIDIPFVLLGLVLGFGFVLIGILFYAFRPIEKQIESQKKSEREASYKKTVEELTAAKEESAVKEKITLKPKIEKPVEKPLQKPNMNPNSVVPADNSDSLPPVPVAALQVAQVAHEHESILPLSIQFDPMPQDKPGPKDINIIIQESILKLGRLFASEGIRIEQDLQSVNKFDLEQQRFLKMFEQLFRNAVDAVRTSARKKIIVRSQDIGLQTIVEIQDTGQGILDENLEKIWQPYFTTKDKNKHQGLGLSEALSVARRFDGEIKIENYSTGGSLVTLTLGLSMQNENSISSAKEAEAKTKTNTSNDLDLDQILNLDDDVVVIENRTAAPRLDLQKEFTTTQFKIDRKIDILEDPKIEVNKAEKKSDLFKVQIRGPRKS